MKRCRTIGIVGTSKNTGKTTTLSYLLNNFHNQKICVTGIGYDGEEIDNITNLPKPRLLLADGITAITSEACLRNTSAKLIIKKRTGFFTPLGEIIKVHVVNSGMLVIAGPNKQSDLESILNQNRDDFDLIFVDGSLNRLAPLSAVDELIFTTGAAYNTDPDLLSSEMKAVERIFSFSSEKIEKLCVEKKSLIDKEDLEELKNELKIGENIYSLNNMLGYEFLRELAEYLSDKEIQFKLILPSPISLLLSGEPEKIISILNRTKNLSISYNKKITLRAVTVNPFYPKLDGNVYREAFINKEILNKKMSEKLSVPVFNVKDDAKGLRELIT